MSRAETGTGEGAARAGAGDPTRDASGADAEALADERDFLLRSLEDLDREHDVGDLSDEDYTELRDRYTARAAAVLLTMNEAGLTTGQAGLTTGQAGLTTGQAGLTTGQAGVAIDEAGVAIEETGVSMKETGVSIEETGVPAGVRGTPGVFGTGGSRDAAAPSRAWPSPPGGSRRQGSLVGRTPPTRRRNRGLLAGGLVCLAAAGVVVVLSARTGPRLPGQTPTGSISMTGARLVRQQLVMAETRQAAGDASGALQLYHQVLAAQPDQPVALAEAGWIEFRSGVEARRASLVRDGQREEQRAVQVAPSAWTPHLDLASMDVAEHDTAGAVAQFRAFLADGPPPSTVRVVEPAIARVFSDAGQSPPPPVGAG